MVWLRFKVPVNVSLCVSQLLLFMFACWPFQIRRRGSMKGSSCHMTLYILLYEAVVLHSSVRAIVCLIMRFHCTIKFWLLNSETIIDPKLDIMYMENYSLPYFCPFYEKNFINYTVQNDTKCQDMNKYSHGYNELKFLLIDGNICFLRLKV